MNTPNTVNTKNTKEETTVDIDKDIPGYLDNYYRFTINFWNIASGWFDLGIGLTMAATTILAGLSQYEMLGKEVQNRIGIATIVTGSISTGLHVLKSVSIKTLEQRRESLKQLIEEYDKRHSKN